MIRGVMPNTSTSCLLPYWECNVYMHMVPNIVPYVAIADIYSYGRGLLFSSGCFNLLQRRLRLITVPGPGRLETSMSRRNIENDWCLCVCELGWSGLQSTKKPQSQVHTKLSSVWAKFWLHWHQTASIFWGVLLAKMTHMTQVLQDTSAM